jgi:hypothetical protein
VTSAVPPDREQITDTVVVFVNVVAVWSAIVSLPAAGGAFLGNVALVVSSAIETLNPVAAIKQSTACVAVVSVLTAKSLALMA